MNPRFRSAIRPPVIVIAITVLLALGVYIILDQRGELQWLRSQLEIKRERIVELETELDSALTADELADLKVINLDFTQPHDRLTFEFKDLKPGVEVGGLTVEAIEDPMAEMKLGISRDNFEVSFVNDQPTVITGVFHKQSDFEDLPGGGGPVTSGRLCFKPDIQSRSKLPRPIDKSPSGIKFFCFLNQDQADKLTGLGSDQELAAKISISNLGYSESGLDWPSTLADLEEVGEIYPEWLELTPDGAQLKRTTETGIEE